MIFKKKNGTTKLNKKPKKACLEQAYKYIEFYRSLVWKYNACEFPALRSTTPLCPLRLYE